MLSLQQQQPSVDAACCCLDNFGSVHLVAQNRPSNIQPLKELDRALRSAGLGEDGETSTTDVVLALSGQQVMVEDSKKRSRAHRSSTTPPGGTARNGSRAAAAAVTVAQDAFAAFTNQYRDVLGDADVEEAEAVYSMVALTQAKAPDWSRSKQAVAATAELPDVRPAKRQQIAAAPAGPACSEGGSSDSSAKSAPSPTPAQPGAAPTIANLYQGMVPGPMLHPAQQMPAGDAAAAAAGGNTMLGSSSMPMAPGFFPGMGMMGLPGAPGMGGVPMPPFMPPWAVPHMMFPNMFGNMGMFGPVPPGSPPMMPMHGPGMLPGMSAMPPAFMPGVPVSGCMVAPAAGEPAAGFPVSGPVPAATMAGVGVKAAPAAVSGQPAGSKPAAGQAQQQKHHQAGQPKQQGVPHKQQQNKAECPAGSPNSSITAAAAAVGSGAASKQQGVAAAVKAAAAKAAAPSSPGIHEELGQLDVSVLKPWVLSHFCEDVYLLLLDVWRPDSPKVRDAIWAWKLHLKTPRTGGSQPDYRAFLVSLFGLEKLLQLTAAVKAGTVRGVVPSPVPLMPLVAAAMGGNAAGSGDSATDNVTLVAAGSRMLSGLAPAASGTVVGSATSPHVLGLTVQPQPA